MTSTNFNIGMSLERASSKPNKDRNSNSDDSDSDDDYIPSSKELNEQELLSEDNSDDDNEENEQTSSKCSKKADKFWKQINKDKDESEESRKSGQKSYEDIEDIWAQFKKDCGQPVTKEKTASLSKTNETESPSTGKCENAKEMEPNVKHNGCSKTKTVTELFEFAGEEVKVTKEVPIENSALIVEENTPATSSKRSACSGGLASVLGQIGKKTKLSVLEKTKLDWDNFKQDEGIAEDLESHNKGKDGYLEKQDFLQRTDLRQFEIEKAMRSSRRLKVLKPPGGGSSNIFSDEPEKPIAPRKNTAHISSIVLSEEASMKISNSSSTITTTTTEISQSQIDAPVAVDPTNNEKPSVEESNVEAQKTAPVPTSAPAAAAPRGRVPPGGFSSGLW